MDGLNPASGPLAALQQMQSDSYQRNKSQLDLLKQKAERAPEDDATERWASMAQASAKVPPMVGNFGALLAQIGGAYGQTLSAQEQREFERQSQIAKLMEQGNLMGPGAVTAMTQAALNPLHFGANGLVQDKATGKLVVPPMLIDQHRAVRQKALEQAVAEKNPNPEAYADRQADEYISRILSNPSFSGAAYAGRPGMAPLPSQGGAAAPATGAISPLQQAAEVDIPTNETTGWLAQLKKDEVEAVATGDYKRATEIQEARTAIERKAKAQPNAAAQPSNLQYQDIPAAEARKTSSVKGAEMYGKQFEEAVMAPAASMANTGKIMTDFNNLGAMQEAMKNGKFKEFMAGDTGKWLLSAAPKGSDLAKGIANAQEAEKLTAGMVNQILIASKGVQTEGDSQRARSQVPSIGTDPDANKYIEAYINETARQLKLREQAGLASKNAKGTWEGYDESWSASPIMREAKGSVKKLGSRWIGLTTYIDKFKTKNPGATDSDAIASWNRVK